MAAPVTEPYTIQINTRDSVATNVGSITAYLAIPDRKYNRVVVTELSAPRTWYNIAAPHNVFTLVENKTEHRIEVPTGNYTRTLWCKTIPALLNKVSKSEYTASWDAVKGIISWSVKDPEDEIKAEEKITERFFRVKGMNGHLCLPDGDRLFSSTGVLEGSIPFNCETVSRLHLHTFGSAFSSSSITLTTATAAVWGILDRVHDRAADSIPIASTASSLQTFTLYDPINQRTLDLNGHHWGFTLQFWRE